MKKDIIIAELWDRGILTEETKTHKNGIEYDALTFEDPTLKSSVKPIIRVKDLEEIPDNEVIESIVNALKEKPKDKEILSKLKDKNYVLNNIFICVRKKTNNDKDVKKTVYEDLEKYMRIYLDISDDPETCATCVITKDIMKTIGIEEKTLFDYAERNSHEYISIMPMEKVLFSGNRAEPGKIETTGSMMYVMTTNKGINGASAMLFQDYLEQIAIDNNVTTLTILPSSIHEVIIWIGDIEADDMIQEINKTEVKDTEQLSNHAYKFTM